MRTVVWWACLCILCAACSVPEAGVARREAASLDDVTNGLAVNGLRAEPAGDPGAWAGDAEATRKAGQPADTRGDRMLVQRGQMEVEVSRVDEALTKFLAAVAGWQGHLQQQAGSDGQQGVTVVVRVPAQRFDEAFALLRSLGRVLRESREAEDVTEEFLDLGIRIDNARRSRERLLEVLARAEKVEDILRVETELRRLTEEIERMEGRRKFLADRVALATLQATFRSIAAPPPQKRVRQPSRFPWINRVGPERVMGDF